MITMIFKVFSGKDRINCDPINEPTSDGTTIEAAKLTSTTPSLKYVPAEKSPKIVIRNFSVPTAVLMGISAKANVVKNMIDPPLRIDPINPPRREIEIKIIASGRVINTNG
jgi:hypothetical protein